MSVKIKTFGCRLNHYESEIIKSQLNTNENTLVINSCAVTNEAEKKVRQYIRSFHKKNPNTKIIVTGCASEIYKENYISMNEVSAIVNNKQKLDISLYENLNTNQENKHKYISKTHTQNNETKNLLYSEQYQEKHLINKFENNSRAFIEIQNGCDHSCTFCVIPQGRGKSVSIPPSHIIEQIRIFIESGYNEIVLTGVDTTSYGNDLPISITLGNLIKRILKIFPTLPRIRLSSIDVAEIDNDLIDVIINEKRFMPHLHLSLQSANDIILKRMKRRHTQAQLAEFIRFVNKYRPEIVFGADIIVGFPTETEDMYKDTYDFIQKHNIMHLHVFSFSPHKTTPAYSMPQVNETIKKHRSNQLIQLSKSLLNEYKKTLLHKTFDAILENNNIVRMENFCTAKLKQIYKNQIDNKLSNIIKIKIIDYQNEELICELV